MTCIIVSQQKTFKANRYMIKCSWSLIKRKIQFRDTMRHHCLLLGGWQTVSVRRSGKGNLAYCCWKYKLIQQLLKTVRKFLKNLNRTTKIYHCSVKPLQSPSSTWSQYVKELFTLAYLLSDLLKPEMKSTVRQALNECKNNNALEGLLFSLKEKVLLFGTVMVSLEKTRLSRINKA